jgi:ribose transport system substrate-binding protein
MTRPEPERRRRWVAFLPIVVLIATACSSGASATPTSAPSVVVTPVPSVAASSAPPASASASASPAAMTADEIIAASGVTADASFCGTKPMTLGIYDGGGINGWSAASYAAVRSEAGKCANVKQDAKAASFSIEKALSDVSGFVAQKYDGLVIIPDAGDELASLAAAKQAGLAVVPWGSDPGGKAGTDYDAYVDWDTTAAGKTWATWMVKALNGKGNVVFLGGFPGSAVGHQQLDGINSVFDQNPGIKLLTGKTDFVPTNWDQATAQKAMTTLLNQYPEIDGVISNYDADAVGIIRAFQAANRPLVPLTTLDSNKLGCDFAGLQAANPKFQMATISSRNWLGRVAARRAISIVQGIPDNEPTSYQLVLFEDSLGGLAPQCDKTQGESVFLSNKISADDLATWGKVTD